MSRSELLDAEIRALTVRAVGGSPPTRDVLDECAALAVWSCLVEPGDSIAGRLVAALGAEGALRAAISRRIPASVDLTPSERRKALERWGPRMSPGAVRGALETAATAGIRMLTPLDAQWPAALHDLGESAPLCLWTRGDPAALTAGDGAVAIVGARAATGYGEHVALELAADLAQRGVSIVSGAAYGIDGVAHRAALATGGVTVALLAGGLDRPYPVGHTDLLDRIAAAGAVVSEVPCGSAPTRWRFLQRNRLIAALSDATVVVEAGWRSGSLNTAGHAATMGRPLGAVPGPVTSAASAGCHRLLREAGAQCVTSADDVMELLGRAPREVVEPPGESAQRTDDRTRVLDALSFRSRRSATDVARLSGMSVRDVESLLGMLSLEGEAESDGRSWRRAREVAAPPIGG